MATEIYRIEKDRRDPYIALSYFALWATKDKSSYEGQVALLY